MAVNPACGNGWVDDLYDGDVDDPNSVFVGHVGCCPCGWESDAQPSVSKAKKAQQDHRYPPKKET